MITLLKRYVLLRASTLFAAVVCSGSILLALVTACSISSEGIEPLTGGSIAVDADVPIKLDAEVPDPGPDKAAAGEKCDGNADCGTGICASGVCCDSPCASGCFSCALPGAVGRCSPLPAGMTPRVANTCLVESPNTCGLDGTCNGVGGCRNHVAGTACGQGSCDDAMETPPSTCNGKGVCTNSAPRACAPYMCSTRACDTECRRDEECLGNTKCLAKKCVIVDAPVIKSTVSVPVVDGEPDDIWNRSGTPWQDISNVVVGGVGSSVDLTARYKALWTAEGIYLLVEVTDSSLSNDSSEVWKDDAIEVYFDANNSSGQTYDNADDVQYLFGWNDGDFSEPKLQKKQGVTFAFATAGNARSYVFEARFPWSTLGLTGATAGKRIGFQLAVNDDDDGGERDAQAAWYGKLSDFAARPASFGELVLGGP